jgi:hypothetical protein
MRLLAAHRTTVDEKVRGQEQAAESPNGGASKSEQTMTNLS